MAVGQQHTGIHMLHLRAWRPPNPTSRTGPGHPAAATLLAPRRRRDHFNASRASTALAVPQADPGRQIPHAVWQPGLRRATRRPPPLGLGGRGFRLGVERRRFYYVVSGKEVGSAECG
uniref:Uncharacterized protein n=1 Tax=Arundo donax TaxID=35708 RepID=A0A0A9AHW2_ARUDO